MTNGAPLILSHRMDVGHFINAEPGWGWTARFDHLQTKGVWPFRYEDEIYEYTLHPAHPLTYVSASGVEYQFDRHGFRSNGGTIPAPVRWMCRFHPMRYPRSYGFHDCSWTPALDVPGREGVPLRGLWVKTQGSQSFSFREMSRHETNALLNAMLLVEGASERDANTITWSVEHLGKRW